MSSADKQNGGVTASAAAIARAPRQVRGQVRVEAILDAAAIMIAEQGLADVTMHGLARRARTSIGSLYHFFPDRDGVLNALLERHRMALRTIGQQLSEIPPTVWRRLSAEAVIARMLTPYLEYVHLHPDYFPLSYGRGYRSASQEDDADLIRVFRHVLDARLPRLTTAERQTYAVMLHAIGAGVVQVGTQTFPMHVEACLREIPRVMTAYLADIEAADGKRSDRARGRKDAT
jgi:AcrR family transcriptional regulator